MDQLLAMRAFTRVVETGSFTRAADSLNMPIATLSKLVKALEAHLDVRLLQRTTRRVTATPEGQDYYDKARRVLIDIEEIDTSFSQAKQQPQGHLRIDVGGSTARDVLIPALPDFMRRYPAIRIDLARGRPAGGSDQRQCGLRYPRRRAGGLFAYCPAYWQCGDGHLCHTGLPETVWHPRLPGGAAQWSQAGKLSFPSNRTRRAVSLYP